MKENFQIVRLAEGDLSSRSDHWMDFKNLLLTNEKMYPEIEQWLRTKVQPGIRHDERVGFVGYLDQKPVVSAVIRKGNDAKVCHLRIPPELQNKHIGEVFWSIMMLEMRDLAKSVHFTLPESLWTDKHGFFESFGFETTAVAEQQYRLFDRELASTTSFADVWRCTLQRIPKLASLYNLGGFSLDNQLLFSIRPEFAERILKGSKTVEIRRKFSTAWIGSKINIYVTAPIMSLVGEATVGAVVKGTPEYIWNRFSGAVGCSKSEFDSYTLDAEEVFAIELRDVTRFREKFPLEQLSSLIRDRLVAPQSYVTLEKNKSWAKAVSVTTYLHYCFEKSFSIAEKLGIRRQEKNPFATPMLPRQPNLL